jgi:hypothetical protein
MHVASMPADKKDVMTLLALSGSLRAASINSAFCRATARLAPESLQVCVFAGLGDLPLFNPDLEATPPLSVQDFRAAVDRASARLEHPQSVTELPADIQLRLLPLGPVQSLVDSAKTRHHE